MAQIPATSNEDVRVLWAAHLVGFLADIAIIPWASPENEPADSDYIAATWEDDNPGWASIHIGPGTGRTYEPGEYVVWTRLTAGDRKPVRRSGLLTIGVLP
ncbi:hypothetical protein GCM10017559_08490 [Streptosporangium longisporum]|uniref:Uncharacterized protein n=1 Tax=Streptosporangium longisporum TaxID=46187 RepID=A0ABN3XTJ8_9ACTN